jgi:hypothetical protein
LYSRKGRMEEPRIPLKGVTKSARGEECGEPRERFIIIIPRHYPLDTFKYIERDLDVSLLPLTEVAKNFKKLKIFRCLRFGASWLLSERFHHR